MLLDFKIQNLIQLFCWNASDGIWGGKEFNGSMY
jgi:hypothetical protein